jgi:hypothetical protein
MKRAEITHEKKRGFNLSDRGRALLELMADLTDTRTKRQKADAAGLNETYAYELTRRPEFVALLHQRVLELLPASLPEAYRALVETASIPGREGAQDRRTLAQVLGDINNSVSVTTTVTQVNTPLPERLREIHERRFAALGVPRDE